MNNDYLKSIDGLRGLAILLVIMFHRDVAYFGWTGVILFFVLSGYLITKVLLTEKDKESFLKTKFKNFWARRILRIFPLYYLYLFILIIVWFAKWFPGQIGTEMPYLITYSYNFYLINVYNSQGPTFLAGHLWSLAIEEQFYLIYPFLIFFCKRGHLKFLVIGLILFSIGFRLFFSFYLFGHSGDDNYQASGNLEYHTLAYMDSFLFGAAIYIFNLDKLRPPTRYLIFIFSILITLIGGLLIYLDLNANETFYVRKYLSNFGIEGDYTKNFYRVWGLVQLNLLFSSLLLLLVSTAKKGFQLWVKRIFELKPLVAMGKVSYGMYVFHGIVIWGLLGICNYDNRYMNKYAFFALCLISTWLVAFVVYHIYEKRFLALKKKFR